MTHALSRLADIHERYDAVLCDVWGVLHNGVTAWPEASKALSQAREAGLAVVLITNSPRPSSEVAVQMDGIGVPRDSYDRIVSSGDVTRDLIAKGPKKVFFLGLDRDLTLLEGLGVTVVAAEEAEAVVCTGPYDDENDVPEQYRPMFKPWIERGIPFICANPDLVVERGEKLVYCAGALAAVYEEMGGATRVSGKPHRPIYEVALEHASTLRGSLDEQRVIAVGDGMPTDVKGAEDYGLDLLYIAGGIHLRDYLAGDRIDPDRLAAFLADRGSSPTYWMPRLA
jgi:HAD superfamily hydrolase (TIGR01459 family)